MRSFPTMHAVECFVGPVSFICLSVGATVSQEHVVVIQNGSHILSFDAGLSFVDGVIKSTDDDGSGMVDVFVSALDNFVTCAIWHGSDNAFTVFIMND